MRERGVAFAGTCRTTMTITEDHFFAEAFKEEASEDPTARAHSKKKLTKEQFNKDLSRLKT